MTEGDRVVKKLGAGLDLGVEWTERESIVLDQIRSTVDRVAVLRELLDAELAKEQVSTRRVTEVAAEIRQCEANVVKWCGLLDPEVDEVKSAQHQAAANARWNRARAERTS